MKKVLTWLVFISLIVFVVAWGVMGLKILDGDYNITVEAYIGLVSIIVLAISGLVKRFSNSKCPYCGKILIDTGKYCSHCGKEL